MSNLKHQIKSIVLPIYCRFRYGSLGKYLAQARLIEGWTTPIELLALAEFCQDLPDNAQIVEIGSFLGRSSVVMAGSRKIQGSGKVYCIDPFDASGDSYSTTTYENIEKKSKLSLRERFDQHVKLSNVQDWIEVHSGTAESVAKNWEKSIDLLFLDGDQSPIGARSSYDHWIPFLKCGGIIMIHNSGDRDYDVEHSGYRKLVLDLICEPHYEIMTCVGSTTIARKVSEEVRFTELSEQSSVKIKLTTNS